MIVSGSGSKCRGFYCYHYKFLSLSETPDLPTVLCLLNSQEIWHRHDWKIVDWDGKHTKHLVQLVATFPCDLELTNFDPE